MIEWLLNGGVMQPARSLDATFATLAANERLEGCRPFGEQYVQSFAAPLDAPTAEGAAPR
jgi:hypothetical protein